jgi:hypothetical protein
MENSRRWDQEVCLQIKEDVAMIAWILTMQECEFIHYLTTTENEGCRVT